MAGVGIEVVVDIAVVGGGDMVVGGSRQENPRLLRCA